LLYDREVEIPSAKTGLVLGLTSLALLALDALIFFEVIRPFRDNHIDQPLAFSLAALGALLSLFSLGARKGAAILNVIALVLNVAALVAVRLLIQSLSHMRLF
jgi:hypothetical protein